MHGTPRLRLDEFTGNPTSLVLPLIVTLWVLTVLVIMAAFALAVFASQVGV